MLAPLYTAAEYLWQLQRLLPRGRLWHRAWGSVQAEQLLTLMPQIVRLNERAIELLADIFPCSTDGLLPEWEATLGLPDDCTGPLPTIQQRQAAVCLKFAARGGQSAQYFIDLAAAAGFPITITTFRPFYASEGRVDDPLYDEAWGYVWQVNITAAATITWFRVDESAVDEPLLSFSVGLLACLLEKSKPAHTQIIFTLAEGSQWDSTLLPPSDVERARTEQSVWDDGFTLWDKQ